MAWWSWVLERIPYLQNLTEAQQERLRYISENMPPYATNYNNLHILLAGRLRYFRYEIDVDLVKDVIREHKVDIHQKSAVGDSILHMVAMNAKLDVSIARFLVADYNVDIRLASSRNGHTPMSVAIRYHNYPFVKYLMTDFGFSLYEEVDTTHDMCEIAVEKGSLEFLQYLVTEHGLDVVRKSKSGQSCFLLAVQKNRIAIVRYMATHLPVDIVHETGLTACAYAVQLGYMEMFFMLIQELKTDFPATKDHLLYLAVKSNQVDMAKMLLTEFHADSSYVPQIATDLPMLCIATTEKWEPMVHCLVEHGGANLDQCAPVDGRAPLIIAAAQQNWSLIKYLVHHGAQIRLRTTTMKETAADIIKKNGGDATYLTSREFCANQNCYGGGKKRCALCRDTRYCGKACQTVHWKLEHKRVCLRTPFKIVLD